MRSDSPFERRLAVAVEFGAGLALTLGLFRVAWLILATSMADHYDADDAKAALGWPVDNSVALLSSGEDYFVRATWTTRSERQRSVLFRPAKDNELVFDESAPARAANVLLARAERPTIGDLRSIARWIDLQSSRGYYKRAAAIVAAMEAQIEPNSSLQPAFDAGRRSPVPARYVLEHPSVNLRDSYLSTAKAFAQLSLISDPSQQGALVLLSDIAARMGDRRRSVALLRLAGGRSLRGVIAHTRLIDFQVSQADYLGAIATADALQRLGGKIRYILGEFLTSAAIDARSYSALSEFLVEGPQWRHSLFARLSDYQDADSGLRLLTELAKKRNALHAADLAPVLQLLTKQGRTAEAYLAWIQFIPESKKSKARLLFDGGFTEDPSNIPFEWNVMEFPRGSIGFLEEPSSGGQRAMRIEFVGARYPRLSAHQYLSLSSGRYRLKMEARADSLRAARGVVWRISCRGERERVLAETEALRGSMPWRDLYVDFEMPTAGCDFPVLRLALSAKVAPELVANGTAFFRNLQLVRRPGPSVDSSLASPSRIDVTGGSHLRTAD